MRNGKRHTACHAVLDVNCQYTSVTMTQKELVGLEFEFDVELLDWQDKAGQSYWRRGDHRKGSTSLFYSVWSTLPKQFEKGGVRAAHVD